MTNEIASMALLVAAHGLAASLNPIDAAEFGRYVAGVEAEIRARHSGRSYQRASVLDSDPLIEPDFAALCSSLARGGSCSKGERSVPAHAAEGL